MAEDQPMHKFDDSSYDVIAFDGIYFPNIKILSRSNRHSETNPDKVVIATGDTSQLKTNDLTSNTNKYDEYFSHCIVLTLCVKSE